MEKSEQLIQVLGDLTQKFVQSEWRQSGSDVLIVALVAQLVRAEVIDLEQLKRTALAGTRVVCSSVGDQSELPKTGLEHLENLFAAISAASSP